MHTAKILSIALLCGTVAMVSAQQPGTMAADAAAGEALFFGKAGCAGCHEVNGRGGVMAPDLSDAGTRSPAALREKILNPNATLASAAGGRGAAPPAVTVKTQDGREIRGV